MEYPFKPKIGQLVAWEMNGGEYVSDMENMGVSEGDDVVWLLN